MKAAELRERQERARAREASKSEAQKQAEREFERQNKVSRRASHERLIDQMRAKYPGSNFIFIHQDVELTSQHRLKAFPKLTREVGCKAVFFEFSDFDGDIVSLVIYDGPMQDVVDAIDWATVVSTDPENWSIEVKVHQE